MATSFQASIYYIVLEKLHSQLFFKHVYLNLFDKVYLDDNFDKMDEYKII